MAITELKPYLSNIADKLKSLLGITDKINAQDFVEKIDEIYEQGKKSQYDEFWDNFQDYGNRTDYMEAFQRLGWNDKNLKPKYDMQPTNASNMFYQLGYPKGDAFGTLNLKAQMENAGVTLDFSNATGMNYCFQTARISRLGVIDLSSAIELTSTFNNTYWLGSIDKMIVSENTLFKSNTFTNCYVSHIIFEGVIACSLSIPQAALDNESLESIIGCLKNIKETGTTLTLTLSASSKERLTDAEKAIITQKGWTLA